MSKRFNPEHLHRLESDERRKHLTPETLLGELGLGSKDDYVDIGVGPGFFALPAAKATQGTVYGVDVSDVMLSRLRERAKQMNLTNVVAVESEAGRVSLPNGCADKALCSLVLHEVQDLPLALSEIRRLLRPQGKLLVIEWVKREMPMGPPLHERMLSEQVVGALEQTDFQVNKTWEISPIHYGVLATRL